MKKFLKDETLYKKFVTYVVTGIILILFFFLVTKFDEAKAFLTKLFSVLSPFIWGGFFSFLLLKLEKEIEEVLPFKKPRTNRLVSSIISVLIVILALVLFFSILIPQVVSSLSQLGSIVNDFTSNTNVWLDNLSKNSFLPKNLIDDLYKYSSSLVSSLWELGKAYIPSIIVFTKNTVSGVLHFIIGFIVAVYILVDRDNLAHGFKKVFRAFLSKERYAKTLKIFSLSYEKFSNFLVGKVVDSLILGIVCFIIMSIFKLDFAVLISVIVCVTNVIPFFGPFIGGIPSALILLIIQPKQAFIFVVMIFILQQIEGNIIEPKVLGDSVGLSSIWVMFSILVGGGFFGFVGMILGVPVFAIIYFTFKEYVDDKLGEEKMNG